MNDTTAAPAVTGDSKTLVTPVPPIKRDADTLVPIIPSVPTAAKGNDEVMSQPAKQS